MSSITHCSATIQRMNEPNFLLNCSNFTLQQFQHINLCRSIASAVCLVVITLILLLLIFYKAHTSTLQRLFLYLTIVTVIQEACITMNVEHQFQYNGQETFCEWIGIVSQWTGTMVYLVTLGIIIYLVYKVCEQFKKDSFPRLLRSKYFRVVMECFFVIIVLMIPLTFLWVPYIHHDFGLAGAWCWMRTINDNCTSVGFEDQLIYAYSIYQGVGVFGVIVTIVLSVVFCRLVYKYQERRQLHMITLRRTLILMGFFVASVMVETVGFGLRLYTGVTHKEGSYVWWIVYAAGPPVSQLIFPLGFLFYFYSLKMFHWEAVKKAAAEWRCFCSCCRRRNAPRLGEDATAPSSHPVMEPSTTYFKVPPTGAFTDVATAEEQQTLLPDGGGDAGYGSVLNAV